MVPSECGAKLLLANATLTPPTPTTPLLFPVTSTKVSGDGRGGNLIRFYDSGGAALALAPGSTLAQLIAPHS